MIEPLFLIVVLIRIVEKIKLLNYVRSRVRTLAL